MLPKAELSFCICLQFLLHEKVVMYHVFFVICEEGCHTRFADEFVNLWCSST
jgi:hypothetical protein